MKTIKVILKRLNICKIIACNMYGEKHSHLHRISIGLIIASIGVLLANIDCELLFIRRTMEFVGFGLHGAGVLPIIEAFQHYGKTVEEEIKEELE